MASKLKVMVSDALRYFLGRWIFIVRVCGTVVNEFFRCCVDDRQESNVLDLLLSRFGRVMEEFYFWELSRQMKVWFAVR